MFYGYGHGASLSVITDESVVSLTAVEGKFHLRLKSGLTLVEVQDSAKCSPFFKMTVSLWERVMTGGNIGTGKDRSSDRSKVTLKY